MKKTFLLFTALLSMTLGFSQTKKTTTKKHTTHTVAKTTTPAITAKAEAVKEAPATDEKMEAAAPVATKAPIEFTESKHSFGKIPQGTPVTYYFSFKNTSSTPIVIESATAQCGCTTPEYPKGAVTKNSSEKIKVTYNAASMGNFTKQVTIRVAKYTEPIVLTIDGEVMAKDEKKEGGK